jgi:hypothetical protein
MLPLSDWRCLSYNRLVMLYLIHEEQRKKIIAAYHARVVRVVTACLACIFVVAGVLTLPTLLLLQSEVRSSSYKIEQFERENATVSSTSSEAMAELVTGKIHILKQSRPSNVLELYADLERVAESQSGVKVQSITIDTLAKSAQIIMEVRDKEVAKAVVDEFNKSRFTGATLPYSLLSQKATFIFAQNLKYE